jgi:hypothetical protein
MTAASDSRIRLRAGILLSGNKIWFSELLAGIVVTLFLGSFLTVSITILSNSFTLHSNDRKITALATDKISMVHALDELRRECRIVTLLRSFAGTVIPDSTLSRVGTLVNRNSAQFGYDPLLLLAVIRVESYFMPNAFGRYESGTPSGAIGLMQLKFETACTMARQLKMTGLKEKDLYNPEINLVLGVAFLTQLITTFKSFKLGLLAYNLGPAVVTQSLSNRGSLPIVYYESVLKSYYEMRTLSAKIERQGEAAALSQHRGKATK